MNKRSFIYILGIIGLLLITAGGYFMSNNILDQKREPSIEVEPIEKTRLETFKNMIKSSDFFKDSKIDLNLEKQLVTIDNKYDIYIKNGYYMMNIKDSKLEDGYCEIVDTIEQSLGGTPKDSIETCKATLNGSMNLGGISAELYDGHKVLTVISDELSLLYNTTTSHSEKELISVDEINYNIDIEDYLLTSLTTKYSKESNNYSVCGHIYNQKNIKEGDFLIRIYDQNKNELQQKEYQYKNETQKFINFCVDFGLELDNIKYYSIEKK